MKVIFRIAIAYNSANISHGAEKKLFADQCCLVFLKIRELWNTGVQLNHPGNKLYLLMKTCLINILIV